MSVPSCWFCSALFFRLYLWELSCLFPLNPYSLLAFLSITRTPRWGKAGGGPWSSKTSRSSPWNHPSQISHLFPDCLIWHSFQDQSLHLLLFISTDQTWTLVNDQQNSEMQRLCFRNRPQKEQMHWNHSTALSLGERHLTAFDSLMLT